MSPNASIPEALLARDFLPMPDFLAGDGASSSPPCEEKEKEEESILKR